MRNLNLSLPGVPRGRLPVIDELKGFAIILVVLYHAGGVLAWNNKLHGELGVDIFIILSGVGLSLSSTVKSAAQFFGRRFVRIFPIYWVVLTAFLVANAYLLNEHIVPKDKVLHYLGIHAILGDAYAVSINDSFWFVSFIIFVYIIYWLIRPLITRPEWVIALGSVISLVVTMIYLHLGQLLVFGHFGARLPGFFLGILLGQLVRNGKLDIPLNWVAALGFFLLLYVGYLDGIIFYSMILAPAVMALYALTWKQLCPDFLRNGTSTFFAFLGRHSLEIFLIHQPLIRQYNLYYQYRWFKISPPTVSQTIVGMAVVMVFVVIVSVALSKMQNWFLSSPKVAA